MGSNGLFHQFKSMFKGFSSQSSSLSSESTMEDPKGRRIVVCSIERAGYIFAHEYPSEGSASSRQKKKLYRMEYEMTKRFQNDSRPRKRNSEYIGDLFADNLVAVATSERSWVRGLVLAEKRLKSDLLKIQLIDYCSHDSFSPRDVRSLPSEFNTSVLECQSMKLVLYGVEPAYLKLDEVDGSKLKGSMHFYDKDIKFIDDQIEKAEAVYFEEICRVEEFYFGDIILKQNDGSLSNLKDTLLKYYGAIEIPDFEDNIPEYIKNFRRYTSTFDHELAVRKLLFPSISFSDVERSTGRDREVEYYRCPPVEIQVSNYSRNQISKESNSNDQLDSANSSTSEETLPVAPPPRAEQFSGECSSSIDKIMVVTGGPNNCIQPVNSFAESPLDSETFQMLKRLQIRDMTRCQKYLVPAIISGQNVTLIDTPGTGKTVGVLISLVSLMWRSAKEKEPGLGARAIVVCPYAVQCERVQKTCLQIIQGRRKVYDGNDNPVTVNVAYSLGTELDNNNLIDLLNGYDILACTPCRLLKLLKNEGTFHFGRLSHIVFDDMNTLLNSYGEEVNRILEYVRRKPKKPPQRIIISDHWMPQLKPFIKEDIELQRGSLLVSSYKDAALFVRLTSIWKCIDDEGNKIKNIIELLKNSLELRNVVVVFSDNDDIDLVYQEVISECSRSIYTIRNFDRLNASDNAKDWKIDVLAGRYPVLFCTDYTLRELQIYEADYLIHYSLPKSKADFLFRFSVLLHRLQLVANEIIKPSQRRIHPRRRPEMCIYSNNKENDEQFPEIVKIMKQLNAAIPDTERLRNILRRKEMRKKEFGLCPNLKEFGRCHRESRCEFRHIVMQDDIPDETLPLSGYIKILVVYVYSATHYGVRILEHSTDSTGPWSPIRGLPNPDIISIKLNKHFFDKQNRKIRAHNKIGDIVAYERNDKFSRVQIMKFPSADISEEKDKHETPKRAIVKFIDAGREEEISTLCLMELPESLASIPPGIVDVFACNLLPTDGDIAWGDQITRIVKNQIMNPQNSPQCYFLGKIELVLGRNLWLDTLRCEEIKAEFKEPITIFSVSKLLKKQGLAISHEGHRPLLLRLCQDAGFEQFNGPKANGSSDENVNIDPVPSNENNDDVEKIHPAISKSRSAESVSNQNVDVNAPSSNENKIKVVEEIHPTISKDHSKQNVLNKSDDVNAPPLNEKKIESVREIHPSLNKSREEITVARKVDSSITPSGNVPPLKKEKDAHFEIIHSPTNICGSEKKFLDQNANVSHVPSNKDKLSNNDHVFKKSNSAGLNGGINEFSSVSRTPLKPQVQWRQDSTYVILTIAVNSDSNGFTAEVTKADDGRKDVLYFCARMDDKFYEFKEILSGRIRRSSLQSYKSGVFICIKMTKMLRGFKWDQLFRTRKPYRWVRMDQNLSDSSDDESNTTDSLYAPRIPRNMFVTGDVGRGDSDSGSSDDSDVGICNED